MRLLEINLSTREIENKINDYNENYNEIITRKNILSRVISNCTNKNEDTLI